MTSGKLENIIKYTKNLNVLYVEDNIQYICTTTNY